MAKPGLHLLVNCKFCEKEFRQSKSNQVFCSKKCGLSNWKLENKKQKEQNKEKCKICGIEFLPKNSLNIYCSKECGDKADSIQKKTKNSGAGKGWSKGAQYVERKTCQRCGKLFYAPPSLVKRGGGKFCSNNCRVSHLAMHPEMYPQSRTRRGKGGIRIDLGNAYFRSAWEANYARYLNLLLKDQSILSWEYEVDTFHFKNETTGSRFYTPDFKIKNIDSSIEYHEVKGYMDKRSAEKLAKMKEYYPSVKIILIDAEKYYDLREKFCSVLPGWEHRR